MKSLFRMTPRYAITGGISGIGISLTIHILEWGLPTNLRQLFFLAIYGFIIGYIITITAKFICCGFPKIFQAPGSIWLCLIIGFAVGFIVVYLVDYLGCILQLIPKTNILYESFGVGILSSMLSFYFNYLKEKDDRIALEVENRKLAVIEERTRIAREIHDSVSQTLFGVNLHLNALKLIYISEPERALTMLNQLQDMVGEVQTEMRLMIYELQPVALIEKGFFEAVESLVELFRVRYNLEIFCSLNGESERLDSQTQLVLYRVLQEALHNVVKHAAAQKITVYARIDANHGELTIEDDGCGFEPLRKVQYPHFGLKDMKERMDQVNGTIEIVSSPGKGTAIKAIV
jgi:signal transduction histidine kinase